MDHLNNMLLGNVNRKGEGKCTLPSPQGWGVGVGVGGGVGSDCVSDNMMLVFWTEKKRKDHSRKNDNFGQQGICIMPYYILKHSALCSYSL